MQLLKVYSIQFNLKLISNILKCIIFKLEAIRNKIL